MRNKKTMIAIVALVVLMSTGIVFAATQQSNGPGNQNTIANNANGECTATLPSLPSDEADQTTDTQILSNEISEATTAMLIAAIEDEYKAQAEYEALIKTFGAVKPFTNIVEAEASHIKALEALFVMYNVSVPENNGALLVAVPNTLTEALQIGIDAEIKNIAIYEGFLQQNLPQEIKETFTSLMNASQNHLDAFQRKLEKL